MTRERRMIVFDACRLALEELAKSSKRSHVEILGVQFGRASHVTREEIREIMDYKLSQLLDGKSRWRCPRDQCEFEAEPRPYPRQDKQSKEECSSGDELIDCPSCMRGYFKQDDGTFRSEPDKILVKL